MCGCGKCYDCTRRGDKPVNERLRGMQHDFTITDEGTADEVIRFSNSLTIKVKTRWMK